MSHFARPFVGLALVVGVLSPFLLAHRGAPRTPPVADKIIKQLGEIERDVVFPNPTPVQDIRPMALQRGVRIEGTLRAAPSQQMAIHGNPFENAWRSPSVGGIDLATGTFDASDTDIALPAEGFGWLIGRNYNARQETSASPPAHRDSNGLAGRNWSQSSQPEIAFYDDATPTKDLVYLMYGADRFAEYQRVTSNGTSFKGVNGAAGVFVFTDGGGGPDTYMLTDQKGNELTFIGFDAEAYGAAGQLWKIKDLDGNVAYVGDSSSVATAIDQAGGNQKGYDSSGRITKAYDTADRRYTYSYTTFDSVVRLTQVKAETKTGGTWSGTPTGLSTVAQVDYAYYTSETYGDPGDLKTVTRTTPLTDSGVFLVQEKYYRYWEGTYNASTNPGYPHEIQYIYDYEGVRRYDWLDSTFDDDHLTASNTALLPYAAAYFEYDASYRIRKAWFNGECGCSAGASNGTFELEYEANASFSNTANVYDTGWCTRTVVKRPDTSYMTQYWDEVGCWADGKSYRFA